MVSIYCIEDINDLKYIGSTKLNVNTRLLHHIYDKKNNKTCSSNKLNLEYSTIYILESCETNQRKEREKYWINKIDCVNIRKMDCEDRVYEYDYGNKYYKSKNTYMKKIREYEKSWGGRVDNNNNSLLKIDINVFS
jgi:hypothetical protein